MNVARRALALLLLLAGLAASGCVVAPVGPGYVYGPRPVYVTPAPVVVAPAPVVVWRRPYPYWW